jgi:hypothetical protein
MTAKKAIIIGLVFLAAMSVLPVAKGQVSAQDDICQVILTRAMQSLETTCNGIARNTACYGNNRVKAEPNGSAQLKFDAQGDKASIRDIRTLVSYPLDTKQGTWGLSLLKLQANLPDSLPGQNVTFVVFGDTTLENASGDMKTFYFSSGLGLPNCKEAPRDAIVVKSPNHTEVSFNANGVQITIASTIILRAQRGQSMSVTLIEGQARVTANGVSQVLQPNQSVTVPLGGTNGLTASGAPSAPVTTASGSDSSLTSVLDTAAKVEDKPLETATNVSVDGCVTAVQGNFITINDYQINVGNNQTLKQAKVGDCFKISGQVKSNNGNGEGFVLVKSTKHDKDGNSSSGNNNNAGGNGNGNNGNGNNAGGNGNGGGGGKK